MFIQTTEKWKVLYLLKMDCAESYLWSAKDSSFSALSVPAVANMMVVSRSAMMPETELAAVMQAWVPLLPAWRADNTMDTWRRDYWKMSKRNFIICLWHWLKPSSWFSTSYNLNLSAGGMKQTKNDEKQLGEKVVKVLSIKQQPHSPKMNIDDFGILSIKGPYIHIQTDHKADRQR